MENCGVTGKLTQMIKGHFFNINNAVFILHRRYTEKQLSFLSNFFCTKETFKKTVFRFKLREKERSSSAAKIDVLKKRVRA